MARVGIRVTVRVGGVTRILIIDNDHPGPPAGDSGEAGPEEPVRELVARVEDLLHRARGLDLSAPAADSIRCGAMTLEPSSETVLRDGRAVRLTRTEFRLLLALVRRRGAIASRGDLLRDVWGADAVVNSRVVDTHIARLRRKLEDDPANPRHILTALAWGYRFQP